MTLIADSGSTKTHWCLTRKGEIIAEISLAGINPFYMSEDEICGEISKLAATIPAANQVESIYFYGAGCAFADKKNVVSRSLVKYFPSATVEVESDLLGAARALFGQNAGIACILGTGSNSCYYDGVNIVDNVSPLGFILGDEGSGAVLGKILIADILKNQLPENLQNKFFETYKITPQQIMENVYRSPFPNRFLASFAPFLAENIAKKEIYYIVEQELTRFFRRNVAQYQQKIMTLAFVGSLAVEFSEILNEVAKNQGFTIDKIEKSPIKGLIDFHSKDNISMCQSIEYQALSIKY
jgi:N-acetylglucosamine kinase-like BadF-type ATPase